MWNTKWTKAKQRKYQLESWLKLWVRFDCIKKQQKKLWREKLKGEGLTIHVIIIQQLYYKKPNVQTTNELMMSLLTLWMTLRKWGVSMVKLVYRGVCKVRENITECNIHDISWSFQLSLGGVDFIIVIQYNLDPVLLHSYLSPNSIKYATRSFITWPAYFFRDNYTNNFLFFL